MSYSAYTSGSESEYETDASESDYEDPRITREQDPRYAILRTPSASTQPINDISPPVGAPWDNTVNTNSLENKVYAVAPKTTKTSLFSMKSLNRDKSLYPTPYNFQLKLPRVYKNVTKFQLVQLSFPNSSGGVIGQNLFLSSLVQDIINHGIPSSCISSCISIVNCTNAMNTLAVMEMARTNSAGDPLLTTISIPNGVYSNGQLADELTFQANSTPPLNMISYNQFKDTFMYTRDASVLFNEPGDTFYSKTGARMYSPTKESIMNTYYTQQHIDGLPNITEQIAFTAYYYPIMKELLATTAAEPFLQGYNELVSRMQLFEGLDSTYYYSALSTNQNALDGFRSQLTFEMRNVNAYTWKFNDNRFVTIHNQLHTSIQRDITKNYQTSLSRELAMGSLSMASFTTLKNNAIAYNSIYKHLETNLSSVLGVYTLTNQYQYRGGSTHITEQSTFDATGLAEDSDFNAMFAFKSSIGGIYGNYSGTVMNFRNFMDYHSTLSTYYMIVQSTNAAITTIHQTAAMNHHMYVSTKYTGVLPQNMIDTKAYTTNKGIPVSFVTGQGAYVPGIPPISYTSPLVDLQSLPSAPLQVDTLNSIVSTVPYNPTNPNNPNDPCLSTCCTYINSLLTKWYACLPVNSVIGTLSYRLGLLSIAPNQYNIISTIQNIISTGNLNFLMQINDEQGFNNMDIAMNEDTFVSTDTTGQLKLVAAKILMGNVGDTGISQTLIQNPSIFENTLGKLDRLNIKIYYDDPYITPAWKFLPFQYDVNEWDATFQIDEEVGFINQDPKWATGPSVPVPKNANETPYLYFIDKETAK
jgi:hypothetical protein